MTLRRSLNFCANMYTYYLIPGIVADHRSFDYLLKELPLSSVRFIRWELPKAGDTLSSYARRIKAQQIDPYQDDTQPVFIGVSMGGIVAVELSRLFPGAPLALIASAKCRYELPPYYRWFRHASPRHWLPARLVQRTLVRLKHEETHQSLEAYRLFKDMLLATPPAFMRWAVDAILNWDQRDPPRDCLHIHGTADRLLPVQYIQDFYPIDGAEHFMIIEHAREIAAVLHQWQTQRLVLR